MKKQILVSLLLLLISVTTMTAQTSNNKYEDDWKKITQQESENLPQSAMETANTILQKAIADKNNTQVIKALIHLNKYKKRINWEERYGLVYDLEKLVLQIDNTPEKSLIYSMLSDLYIDLYNNDRWQINQRTNLEDLTPDDIKEWSRNLFFNKVVSYLNLSIENTDELQKHTTKEYDDIIVLGEDGQTFYPTLYDFLMKRAINMAQRVWPIGGNEFDISKTGLGIDELTAPASEYINFDIKSDDKKQIVFTYFQQYLKSLLQRNLISTVVFMDVDRLKYIAYNSWTFNHEKVLKSYEELYRKYEDNDASCRIVSEIVDLYSAINPSDIGVNATDINKLKYDWLQKGIKKHPDTKGAIILKEKLDILETPTLIIDVPSTHSSGESVKILLEYKNTQLEEKGTTLTLYRIEKGKYIPVKKYPLNLVSKTTYNADTLRFDLGTLPFGEYNLSSLDDKTKKEREDNNSNLIISDLSLYSRNSAKNEHEILVLNRTTGKPIEDATVTVFQYIEVSKDKYEKDIYATLRTDKMGLAYYTDKRTEKENKEHKGNLLYKVNLKEDSYMEETILREEDYKWSSSWNINVNNENTTSIFTDRSIYRPGQTIHFKAITLDRDSKLVTGKAYIVKLHNPNDEVISEKEIISNEFGSISGSFVIPQNGLLGEYDIEIEKDRIYLNVEEYKRPTFDITFDKVDKTYTFGEEVKVKGYAKNFSGVSLQDATVKYNITRSQVNFWWIKGGTTNISEGTVETNADGSFDITFTPEPGDAPDVFFRSSNNRQIYSFTITATITDSNGETQSNTHSLTVGNVSMLINIDIPDKIEKTENYTLKIDARNLQAQEIKTTGTYDLYKLDDKDSIQGKVLSGNFSSGEQSELKEKLKTIASGKYQLEVKALDSNNNEVSEKKNFISFSYTDKRPPFSTSEWFVSKNTTFDKNTSAQILYGTTDKDAYVLYQLSDNEQVFERRFVKINNANHLFTIPYKAEYGDNVNVSFFSVRKGQVYNQNLSLTKKIEEPDLKLNIKLDVFRDKLRPGQEETWTISVKDTTNTPILAELLASMYDTSLDKLSSYNPWNLIRLYKHVPFIYPVDYTASRWETYFSFQKDYSHLRTTPTLPVFLFDQLDWAYYFMSQDPNFDEITITGMAPQKKVTVAGAITTVDVNSLKRSNVSDADAGNAESIMYEYLEVGAPNIGESSPTPQIRKNFDETAFFFPQLRTNEKGETLISFTVPESNTNWRFRALAHDKDTRVGTLERMVVTRKELMVTPNMPRFIRQGDKTSISTKISNLSENPLSGEVRIEFFDPTTEKIIDLNVADQKQSFSINKDASTSVTWTFDVPKDIELIGCRIVAQNESFSDGEQHVLAVLSNRMLVTESLPINIHKAGTSTFTLDKLYKDKSASRTNYNLTLEYASNPAWYAIQTLPTMSNPSNENAVNWFASYYVNTLGSSIVRQYPKVSAMIESWLKQGGDKETLVSKLQKDEDLKSVLLEETPWVLDAKNETEQMQRLSLLFDLNNTKQLTQTAIKKLKDLENKEGGWGWYKGFYPNRSITQYILQGYAKLQQVGQVEYTEDIKVMQMNAIKFIDKEVLKDFNNLQKVNPNWKTTTSVSNLHLEYAYTRSLYRDIPIEKETREAERFFTDVASKNWKKLTRYQQALLSVILKRNGDSDLANKIVKSIREYAVNDSKLGMYWPNNRSGVFFSMSSICAHTYMMEALLENGATEKEMDAMKRWLINQKRTQMWESTHASIDAINILLSSGSDWFVSEATATDIKVGGKKVEPENKELGTGYFKETWSKSEINNNMGKVEITTPNSNPAFGALYWQYYDDIDKITAQKGDLNVDKQLFKETVSANGKGLTQITESNPLTIGDKVIVRLTVRVDRDMEFVHLKDMRAACFEPEQTTSGTQWRDGLVYYQTSKDASINYFFDRLPKGTYVLEYSVYTNRSGEYSNGITTIQCMYASEFTSHTQGIKVTVKDK